MQKKLNYNFFYQMQKIKFKAVFSPFNLRLFSAKLRSNVDFAPQNFKAVQTLPHKMTKPLYFAPQNNKAFILCSAKLKKKKMQTLPCKITEAYFQGQK